MRVLSALMVLGFGAWSCGFCLLVAAPNLLVSMVAAQLPFGQAEVARWQMDQPMDLMVRTGDGRVPAGVGHVKRAGYSQAPQPPAGLPLHGPITHWGDPSDQPLLGCRFQDPHYLSHVGADFPVDTGTPVYATLAGQVVWAGVNGAWGLLVVIENGPYQVWLAHNSAVNVRVGDLVQAGQAVAASGNTGNSSGPHVHYGVKQFMDDTEALGVWVNPEGFFSPDAVSLIGCGG